MSALHRRTVAPSRLLTRHTENLGARSTRCATTSRVSPYDATTTESFRSSSAKKRNHPQLVGILKRRDSALGPRNRLAVHLRFSDVAHRPDGVVATQRNDVEDGETQRAGEPVFGPQPTVLPRFGRVAIVVLGASPDLPFFSRGARVTRFSVPPTSRPLTITTRGTPRYGSYNPRRSEDDVSLESDFEKAWTSFLTSPSWLGAGGNSDALHQLAALTAGSIQGLAAQIDRLRSDVVAKGLAIGE